MNPQASNFRVPSGRLNSQSIERLYVVFAPYQLHQYVDGCPCCVGDADQRRIRAKPLRELGVEDLERYAFKAITTWGDADDFRHFLPRLFELQARSPVELIDVEVLFGKLAYAEWHTWPAEEQQAISEYFSALWQHVIHTNEPTPYTNTDDYLCGIAQAVDDLQPYLASWVSDPSRISLINLNEYIIQNLDALIRRRLDDAFWKQRAVQMRQVVSWLIDESTINQLETLFYTNQDYAYADELVAVIDTLQQLHNIIRPKRT